MNIPISLQTRSKSAIRNFISGLVLVLTLYFVSNSHAAIVQFEELTTDFTNANALNVTSGGTGVGPTVTAVNNGAAGIVYSVSLTDNFGTGIGTQTLSFDVLVTGSTGAVVNFGTLAGGNNDNNNSSVDLTPAVAAPVVLDTTAIGNVGTDNFRVDSTGLAGTNFGSDATRFNPGETITYQITNTAVTGGFIVANELFTDAFFVETLGSDHRVVFGEGSNLFGSAFNGQLVAGNQGNFVPDSQLVVTATGGAATNNANFGLRDVDFQLEIIAAPVVIPEPTTLSVLGLTSLLLLFGRSKRRLEV